MCVLGAEWGLGGMELGVCSNNIMIFSLHIAASQSHTVHVLYIFVCIYIYIVSCHIYVLLS